jgi:hypothetical protein
MKMITAEIEKIRAVREKISASFGHDPNKLVEYYADKIWQPGHITKRTGKRGTAAKLVSKK